MRNVPEGIDLIEIKRWLVRGDIKNIAVKLGMSPEYTSLVLSGKNYNEDILSSAYDVAIERRAKFLNRQARLNQLQ